MSAAVGSPVRRAGDRRRARRDRPLDVAALGLFAACGPAHAQSTGAVTGPKIAPDDRAAEIRFAYDPGTDRYAQRLHYQHAVSRDWRLRAILVHDHVDGDFRFRSLTLQAHHQFRRAPRGWNAALQVQGVIPDGEGGPGQARIAWANSLDIVGGGELRFAAYAARPVGDAAPPGVFLETRAEASFPVGGRWRLGVQSFDEWGSTAAIPPLARQSHRLGPLVRRSFPERFALEASAQIGVTDGASDTVLRLFAVKSF